MRKKLLIAAGGSGGHVYPALALAKNILSKNPNVEVVFAAGGLSKNKFIDRRSFRCIDIPAGQVLSNSVWQMTSGAFNLCRGVLKSRQLLQEFSPDLIVGFGSYHTLPILAAAKLSGFPFVLHAADSIPGKVVRLFSRWALLTGIHFPVAAERLKGHSVRVGIPLRIGFAKGSIDHNKACRHYGLEEGKPIVLVFGGSQGARKLNSILLEAIRHLPHTKGIQFIHFTGDEKVVGEWKKAYETRGFNACVKGFEPRMDIAWSAATAAIVRAGANTVAELIEYEVPSILVPFPHAADRHQEFNARYVEKIVGGVRMYQEKELDGPRLAQAIYSLLEESELQVKRASLSNYKKQAVNQDFGALVMALL